MSSPELFAQFISNPIQCIQELFSANVITKTLTTDLCTKNVAVLNKLGVTKSKPYFEIMLNGRMEKIFVFPDFPHVLKCLRNAFLDHGIFIATSGISTKKVKGKSK